MLSDFLFPNRCLDCNRIISSQEIICELCFDKIHFTYDDFAGNNPLKQKCQLLFPVENAVALTYFEKDSLNQKIIHTLKYGNREIIGKTLANWVTERVDIRFADIDLIVTIPLHPQKLKKRGYNQLHLLGNALSKIWKIPIDHAALVRNYHSKEQAKKDRLHRKETKNQYSISREITNQHILILDDVFTTGNTMSTAAWEFLQSGNNKVSVLVMALD